MSTSALSPTERAWALLEACRQGATWQAILLNDSGPALLNMLRN